MESLLLSNRNRWHTLKHNGVAFPAEYVQRGIAITIHGEEISLDRQQEEMVYAWAKKKDTHYVKDPIFQSNFLYDLKKMLPDKFENIKEIEEFDFREAYALVEKEAKLKEDEKEKRKALPKEERKKISQMKKREKEALKKVFGLAYLDDAQVEVANWLVEPPGIFMGRGQHPLRGRWKPRVKPSDIILNLGENAPVPDGNWKQIVHDHTSTWLASWTDSLTGKRKYVWLHDSSSLRQESDKIKYDRARLLERHIETIRNEIVKKMRAKDEGTSKIATVCYLIYKLAMRVGDEKDPDEADTVGATTLRVEHVSFPESNGSLSIQFYFTGKDSVPWQKKIEVNSDESKTMYENLSYFIQNKDQKDQIFEDINSTKVNKFLQSIDKINIPNLTAKVFRTYLATNVVKESLMNPPVKLTKQDTEALKIYVAKTANLQAAIACNHKKGIDPNNPAAIKMLERYEISTCTKRMKIENIKSELRDQKYKTEKQIKKAKERLEKLELQLRLQQETKDYNLGTSLRNYIDPRLFKAWSDYIHLDWTRIYTATLQRKFKWVEGDSNTKFCKIFT